MSNSVLPTSMAAQQNAQPMPTSTSINNCSTTKTALIGVSFFIGLVSMTMLPGVMGLFVGLTFIAIGAGIYFASRCCENAADIILDSSFSSPSVRVNVTPTTTYRRVPRPYAHTYAGPSLGFGSVRRARYAHTPGRTMHLRVNPTVGSVRRERTNHTVGERA